MIGMQGNFNRMGMMMPNMGPINHMEDPSDQQDMVTEILNIAKVKEGFYIGDKISAISIDVIIQFKITHMINATGNQIMNQWESIGISYLTLNWSETPNQILFDSKDEIANRIVSFIDNSYFGKGEGLLAHSFRGQNRVCIVVLIYLMKKYKWSLKKSFEYLKSKKQNVDIPNYFFQQLINFENRLRSKGELTRDIPWEFGNLIDPEEKLLRNTYLNGLKPGIPDSINKSKDNLRHIMWADNNAYQKFPIEIINSENDLFFKKEIKPITVHQSSRPLKGCIKGQKKNNFNMNIQNNIKTKNNNSVINKNIINKGEIEEKNNNDNEKKGYNKMIYNSVQQKEVNWTPTPLNNNFINPKNNNNINKNKYIPIPGNNNINLIATGKYNNNNDYINIFIPENNNSNNNNLYISKNDNDNKKYNPYINKNSSNNDIVNKFNQPQFNNQNKNIFQSYDYFINKEKNKNDKRIPNDFENKKQNNNLNENSNNNINIINMRVNNSVNIPKPSYNIGTINSLNSNNIKNLNIINNDNSNEFKRSKNNGFPVSNSMMNNKSPNISRKNLEDKNSKLISNLKNTNIINNKMNNNIKTNDFEKMQYFGGQNNLLNNENKNSNNNYTSLNKENNISPFNINNNNSAEFLNKNKNKPIKEFENLNNSNQKFNNNIMLSQNIPSQNKIINNVLNNFNNEKRFRAIDYTNNNLNNNNNFINYSPLINNRKLNDNRLEQQQNKQLISNINQINRFNNGKQKNNNIPGNNFNNLGRQNLYSSNNHSSSLLNINRPLNNFNPNLIKRRGTPQSGGTSLLNRNPSIGPIKIKDNNELNNKKPTTPDLNHYNSTGFIDSNHNHNRFKYSNNRTNSYKPKEMQNNTMSNGFGYSGTNNYNRKMGIQRPSTAPHKDKEQNNKKTTNNVYNIGGRSKIPIGYKNERINKYGKRPSSAGGKSKNNYGNNNNGNNKNINNSIINNSGRKNLGNGINRRLASPQIHSNSNKMEFNNMKSKHNPAKNRIPSPMIKSHNYKRPPLPNSGPRIRANKIEKIN